MSHKKKSVHLKTLTAVKALERLGLDPIAEIYEAMCFAKEMAKAGGNINSENGTTDQSTFVNAWLKGAVDLARFRYPMISAIAIQDLTERGDSAKPMTSIEALEIIKKDPFLLENKDVVDAMKTSNSFTILPKGNKDDV